MGLRDCEVTYQLSYFGTEDNSPLSTRHFRPQTLEVGRFHGDGRAKTPNALLSYDIVLTTYHTLAADWKGKKILQKIAWFRVTLDEGKSAALF